MAKIWNTSKIFFLPKTKQKNHFDNQDFYLFLNTESTVPDIPDLPYNLSTISLSSQLTFEEWNSVFQTTYPSESATKDKGKGITVKIVCMCVFPEGWKSSVKNRYCGKAAHYIAIGNTTGLALVAVFNQLVA